MGRWRTRSKTRPISFPLGRLVATPGALAAVSPEALATMIGRHLNNDWNVKDQHDWRVNDDAVRNGGMLLSSYETAAGVAIWVITEHDRSVTTILLPEER